MMSAVTEPGNSQPLLIVADNYRLAQQYAREHALGPERRSWRFVSHVRDVQGIRTGTYVVISTGDAQGRDLLDRIELGQYLRALGFHYQGSADEYH